IEITGFIKCKTRAIACIQWSLSAAAHRAFASRRTSQVGFGKKNVFSVRQCCPAIPACAINGGGSAGRYIYSRLGIGEIHIAVLREVRMQCDVEKSTERSCPY